MRAARISTAHTVGSKLETRGVGWRAHLNQNNFLLSLLGLRTKTYRVGVDVAGIVVRKARRNIPSTSLRQAEYRAEVRIRLLHAERADVQPLATTFSSLSTRARSPTIFSLRLCAVGQDDSSSPPSHAGGVGTPTQRMASRRVWRGFLCNGPSCRFQVEVTWSSSA